MGISLPDLFVAADDMLTKASTYREENKIIELHSMLLRFVSLLTVNIQYHRDYQKHHSNEKAAYDKKLSDVLMELEELKPAVQQQVQHRKKLSDSPVLADSMDACLKQLFTQDHLKNQIESTRDPNCHGMSTTASSDSLAAAPGEQNSEKGEECGICLEKKSSSDMFNNNMRCSHSFCCTCIGKHITNRLNDKNLPINCPKPNCRVELLPENCQVILSGQIIEKWGLVLAEASIPDSKKCYCPYPDCSTPLINDAPPSMTKTECPSCMRSFCAQCRVPWHKNLTCCKFQKSSKRKDDNKLFQLARRRKWKQCGQCNSLVERSSGCHHMTCRCGYQFCYKCGSKWMRCNFICRWRRCLGDR